MNAVELAPEVYAAGQIFEQDIKIAADHGVRTIINNRPDHEEMGQPLSVDLERFAQSLGLAYVHIPIVTVPPTDQEVDDFARIWEQLNKPILLFCCTGARSKALWQINKAHDNN